MLVLNANFEPLNICSTRRAINLLLSGRANLIINGRGVIHSISRSIPAPSVIRLSTMVKRPRPRVRLTKREILRRDNYTCQYCGQRVTYLTIDHIVPRRLGGEYSWTNLVAACPHCNHRKGGHTLDQVSMHLLRTPTEPPSSAAYRFNRHISENVEWQPFIEGW